MIASSDEVIIGILIRQCDKMSHDTVARLDVAEGHV
jgi:hypothetical protein